MDGARRGCDGSASRKANLYAGERMGAVLRVVDSLLTATRVRVRTVMSSSCPKACAASATFSAEWREMAAVRSKAKRAPDGGRASTTPWGGGVGWAGGARWRVGSGLGVSAAGAR